MVDTKKLPKGICWREDKQLFMGRFTFEGKTYTFYDKDLKKITKTLENRKYEIQHGLTGAADRVSLDNWFFEWMNEYKRSSVKTTSFNHYMDMYTCYAQAALGKKTLAKIRAIHIQKVYNDMVQRELSVGTVNSLNALLFAVFQAAVKNDLILKNPCMGVDLPRAQKIERRVLSLDEQTRLLYHMGKDKWVAFEPLITFMLSTGLRLGEALGLTWDCVDLEGGEVSIKKGLVYVKEDGKFSFRFQTPKSQAGVRVIPLVKEAADALRRQRTAQMRLKSAGAGWKSLDNFELLVFTTSKGTPIQESVIRKTLVSVVQEINAEEKALAEQERREPILVAHIFPHCLRHTFATRCFEQGVPPKTVQAFLGHSTLAMTMDLYTHLGQEKKRADMAKLEGVFCPDFL